MRAVDADGRHVELTPLGDDRFRHPDGRAVGIRRASVLLEPGQSAPPGFWLPDPKLRPHTWPRGWRRAVRIEVAP